MKEIPMLYSTPMVQALIADKKTQTSRIITSRSSEMTALMVNIYNGVNVEESKNELIRTSCPYGKPGDLIWARERWRLCSWDFDDSDCTIEFFATADRHTFYLNDETKEQSQWLQNQIDGLVAKGFLEMVPGPSGDEDDILYKSTGKPKSWKPSIHMPKEASRIWLEVLDISISMIQDITEDEAKAEGVLYYGDESGDYKNYLYNDKDGDDWGVLTAKKSFETLWESINGEKAWKDNPLVWVVKFKVISKTGWPEIAIKKTY